MIPTLGDLHPDLAALIALDSGGDDEWAWVMQHWFAVAETLYRHGEDIPATWKFQSGSTTPRDWPDCEYNDLYLAGIITSSDLVKAGEYLNDEAARLRAAGKDY